MNFKTLKAHFIAIAVFIGISLAYFSPVLDGKQLRQSDITQFKGMSKEIADYREQNHEEPLWTNSMFGGMPAYQISVLYKNNVVQYVDRLLQLGLPHPAGLLFLSLLGFYFLMITLGASTLLAAVGAIAFSFSSFTFVLIDAGHNTQAHATAYIAPVVAGILLTYRGRLLLGAAVTALALSLEINCNHLQITYYLAILIGFILVAHLVKAFKEKQLPQFFKASLLVGAAALLAIGPNITNLWSTYEYGKYSTRGKSELTFNKEDQTTGLNKSYATQWSYGVSESFTLLVPNFKGGSSSKAIGEDKAAVAKVDPQYRQYIANMESYFGEQPFTSGPVYVGAIICFLFILGLFIVEGELKWWALGATILALMLSWGKNFMPLTNFFFDYVPGYDKFRSVYFILTIAEFTMPLLAVVTIKQIIENPAIIKQKKKEFFLALGLTGGLALLFVIMPSVFTDFLGVGEQERITGQLRQSGFPNDQIGVFIGGLETARASILTSDALRSMFFILLAAAAVWLYASGKFKTQYFVIIIGVLVLLDMGGVCKRFLSNDEFVSKTQIMQPLQPTQADELIMQDKDLDYRVMNLSVSWYQNATTSYFHKSIGGYHGAKLKRYDELMDHQLLRKNNMAVLNMLNTRYFIVPDDNTHQPMVQRNSGALGNAWFVKEYKIVPNADSEITALSNFEPAKTLVVDKRFEASLKTFTYKGDATAKISLLSYKPNDLVYQYIANTDQLAVFSEIYYDKGWNAYVDGKQSPYFRANYVLRAMLLPAGSHKVEFKFEPACFYTGEKVALASSLLLVLLLAGIAYTELRRNR